MKLEESAELVRRVSEAMPSKMAARLQQQAKVKKKQAATLRNVLEQLEPYQWE